MPTVSDCGVTGVPRLRITPEPGWPRTESGLAGARNSAVGNQLFFSFMWLEVRFTQ